MNWRQPYRLLTPYERKYVHKDNGQEYLPVWVNSMGDEVGVGFEYNLELNEHLK
jgi:hypothetical protein